MIRLTYLTAVLVLIVIAVSAPSAAQTYGYGDGGYPPGFYTPGYYGPITPEIHLGSATEPSVIRVPPVFVQTPGPDFEFPGYAESENEPMANAAMPGYFDFLVSPVGAFYPGSMSDSSVSLGDYAREIRSQKHGPPPIVLTPGMKLSR